MKERILKCKKCKFCKNEYQPLKPLQMVCSWKCGMDHTKFLAEQKEKKETKEKHKEYREKTKTLTEYEAEAKKAFQHFIRLRDKDQPCISCGNNNPSDWCGSHYFAAGVYSGLMFDERNCHGACNTYCNKYLSGNLLEYRKGLIKRFGEDFVKQLEEDSNSKRDHKYTKNELIAKKLQYDLKIKEWKKMK